MVYNTSDKNYNRKTTECKLSARGKKHLYPNPLIATITDFHDKRYDGLMYSKFTFEMTVSQGHKSYLTYFYVRCGHIRKMSYYQQRKL